jgi:hypothetical protein
MKVDSRLLFQKTGIFQNFKLGALSRVSIFCFGTLGIWHQSFVSFFVICYDSNAMPFSNYFSNVVTICVDFLCLDFDVQLLQKKPKIAFSAVVVNSINYSSFQRHLDVAAPLLPRDRSPTKIAMAHQRAAKARLYKLPLDAAVQSRRPDLIEFGGLPALALPRDKLP